MRRLILALVVLLAALGALVWAGQIGWGPFVITREGEQKIVLLLGSPVSVQTKPGISLRLPLASSVLTFDRRLLYFNSQPQQIQTGDAERPLIDHYVVWRIVDPVKFVSSFPSGMSQAEAQIDRVTRSDLREVIGQKTLAEVVTTEREKIMKAITEKSAASLADFGIEVRDVRINRTELPPGAEENVFARMRSQREQLARKFRAEGDQDGRRIRAEADRDARVIVADAHRDAEILRGEGDAESARIYAEAHSIAPEFYGFLRRLEAYKKTIGDKTTLVVAPDNDFFKLLGHYDAKSAPSGP
ncbi:MAG TPA: protease modulator HflC [Myxococcota bacterium]|nr:protease modulator HflC [Myxococcota bacterium]